MTPFWKDKERLHRLAGIMEDDTDDTSSLNAQANRQAKVIKLITDIFNRLQLPLTDDNSVVYYEDEDFKAVVTLDILGDGISIKNLAKLYTTGLSIEYTIDFAKAHGIQVQFIVDPKHRDPN